MRKFTVKFYGLMASLALVLSVTAANRITGFIYHQPELPDKVKALRKF